MKKSKMDMNIFSPDEHGFFNDLVTMIVSLSSYFFTMHVSILSNNPKPFSGRKLEEWFNYIRPVKDIRFPLSLYQKAENKEINFFPAELLMNISLDHWPQWIEYQIVSASNQVPDFRLTAQGNSRIISQMVGYSFINYYTNNESTFKKKFGLDKNKWPDVIRFAWVMRNAFAHGGIIKINDTALRPVKWKIWSFDFQNNGQNALFEPSLGIGDVISLMNDFDNLVNV